MSQTQLTTLTGRSQFAGFRFEREELAFFEENIWSVHKPEPPRLAATLRTAFADLSMNPALKVDYEVNFDNANVEVITISTPGDTSILRGQITNSSFYGHSRYERLQNVPVALSAFELANAGRKYGYNGEVDFETISYKLRQLMTELRYSTGFIVGHIERPDGKFMQLTFRPWNDTAEPDNGKPGQFHLVIEVKYCEVVPVELDDPQAQTA